MAIFSGLRAVAVSTAALATTITGVAVYSTAAASDTVGVPVAASAQPQTLTERALELTRSQTRPAPDPAAEARAEALSVTVAQIGQHDADLKAQAAAKAAAEKAAAEAAAAADAAFLAEQGYARGTTSPKEIARQIAANKYGWGAAQFQCYDNIIMRESMWITTADNPTSSAYGIPQALPGNRMASFGADWRTNPATQIKWGLNYIKERYGTPCAGWSFKRAHGWY